MWVAALACLLLASWSPANAQSIYGTLTGVVSDQSQALVPNAKVTLTNSASGDVRRTVTNSDGYFTFASVPVGSYDVTVEAAGFTTYKASGIPLGSAEKRNIDVIMKVGNTSETVEVSGTVDLVTPVDSGEKSATLTQKQLQDFSVVGRSAAEFIKILPGFSIAGTGTENRTNFTGENIGINGNGDGGSQSAFNGAYSVNGLPGGSLDITADGAHVSDPGCNCATPVNPNTDMIQEFKVLTSNFSAENQKGPAVVNSIAKAGGRDFHGGAYLYARHYSLNANDWLNNRSGQPRPQNKYFFPGGNIGGPILIPGTNINKNRDKLFFFTGFEYYAQTLDTGLLRATVPTAGMRNGNFSPAELARLGTITAGGGPPAQVNQDRFPGGIIPANLFDASGRGLMNLYPLPNRDPNQSGGFNYIDQIVFDQNSMQSLSRVDYSISDNTKLYVRYNYQRETQQFPVGLWWRNGNQVPYPTPVEGRNRSHSVTSSLTHVFSPTLTNEFVFGFTVIQFPNVFANPDAVDRTKLGIPFRGLFKNGVTQIPAMTGWGGEFATLFNPGGFEVGGNRGLFADKYLPTISNNVSKVWGTHTAKFGFFWEYIINTQPGNGYTNGLSIFSNWGNGSTGSAWADLLTGRPTEYQEQSFNRNNNIGYHTFEFFAQDQWKVTRRLTLEYGLRASHFQPWQDRLGFGFTVFDPSAVNPNAPATEYSGFSWNKRDPNVPNAGFQTRALYFGPRVGAAYDLFGNGRTVLRGGWGRFNFHTAQFTTGLDVSAGVRARTIRASDYTGGITFPEIQALTAGPGDRLGVSAVDRNSDRTPGSDSWSVTLSQRLPFSSLIEVSYVGNRSRNLLYTAPQNAVPAGALFSPSVADPNDVNIDNFRPFRTFQNVDMSTHGFRQNYNAMQVSWLRSKGRYNINANYTWGKQLGYAGLFDPFNLDNNYGVMPNDRRHIFNIAYSVELGNLWRGANPVAKGLLNGWQLSGISQVQSGVNLVGNTGYNLNLDAAGVRFANGRIDPNGLQVTNRSIYGTDAIPLRLVTTCNPTADLRENQFFNPACFSLPTARNSAGPLAFPPIYGPWFQNHDLGLFKNFNFSESKRLQFRFNAYNFLNMPLYSFINGSPNIRAAFDGNAGSATYGRIINPNFGTATEKQGRRIIQLAVKFYF